MKKFPTENFSCHADVEARHINLPWNYGRSLVSFRPRNHPKIPDLKLNRAPRSRALLVKKVLFFPKRGKKCIFALPPFARSLLGSKMNPKKCTFGQKMRLKPAHWDTPVSSLGQWIWWDCSLMHNVLKRIIAHNCALIESFSSSWSRPCSHPVRSTEQAVPALQSQLQRRGL